MMLEVIDVCGRRGIDERRVILMINEGNIVWQRLGRCSDSLA